MPHTTLFSTQGNLVKNRNQDSTYLRKEGLHALDGWIGGEVLGDHGAHLNVKEVDIREGLGAAHLLAIGTDHLQAE